MSPSTAFDNAAGGSTSTIALIAVGVIATAVLLWAGWALLSVYLGWARTRVDTPIAQRAVVRIVALTLVILWIALSNA